MKSRKFIKLLAFVFALGATLFLARFCLAYDFKSLGFSATKKNTIFSGKIGGGASGDVLKFIVLIRPSQAKALTAVSSVNQALKGEDFSLTLNKTILGKRQDYTITGYSKPQKTLILNVERKNADIYQRCCQFDENGRRSAIIYYTGEKNPSAWPYATRGTVGNNIFQTMTEAQNYAKDVMASKDIRQCVGTQPKPINFSFIVDISGSMGYPAGNSKIKQVIDVLKRIVREKLIAKDNVNLSVVSAGDVILSLTGDKNAVIKKIEGLSAEGEVTKLFDAVAKGIIDAGKNTQQKRVAVVFSDGNDNASRLGSLDAINIANKNFTPIYTVSVGNNYPEYTYIDGAYVKVAPNRRIMSELAAKTKGKYRHVSQVSDILDFFDALLNKEREEIKRCEETSECKNITVSAPCAAPPAPNKKVVFIFNRYFDSYDDLADSDPERATRNYFNLIVNTISDGKVKNYIKDNDQFAALAYDPSGIEKVSGFAKMQGIIAALKAKGSKYFTLNSGGAMGLMCEYEYFYKSIEEAEKILDQNGGSGKKVIFMRTDCVPNEVPDKGLYYVDVKKRLAAKDIELQVFDNSESDISPNDSEIQWYGFAKVFPKMMQKLSDSCADAEFTLTLDPNVKISANNLVPAAGFSLGDPVKISVPMSVDLGQKFTASFDITGKTPKPVLDLVASYKTWESQNDGLTRFATAGYKVGRCLAHDPKISVVPTKITDSACDEIAFNYEISCFDANNPDLSMTCQGVSFNDSVPKDFEVILDTPTDSSGNSIKLSSKSAPDANYRIISSNEFAVSGKLHLKIRYRAPIAKSGQLQTFVMGKYGNAINFQKQKFNYLSQKASFVCGNCWTVKAQGQCLGTVREIKDVVLVIDRGAPILQDDGKLDEKLYIDTLKRLFISKLAEETFGQNDRIAVSFYSNKYSIVDPVSNFMDFPTFKKFIENLNPKNLHEMFFVGHNNPRPNVDFIYDGFDQAANTLISSGRPNAKKIVIGVSVYITYSNTNTSFTVSSKFRELAKKNIKGFLIYPWDPADYGLEDNTGLVRDSNRVDSAGEFAWYDGRTAFAKILSLIGIDYCKESRFSYALQSGLSLLPGSEKPQVSQPDTNWLLGNRYIPLANKVLNGYRYWSSLSFNGESEKDYLKSPDLAFMSAKFGFKDTLSGLNFREADTQLKVQRCSDDVELKAQRIVRPICGGFEAEIQYSCQGSHQPSTAQFCPTTIIEDTIPRVARPIKSSLISAIGKVGGMFTPRIFPGKDILGIDAQAQAMLYGNTTISVEIPADQLGVGQIYWLKYRAMLDFASKYSSTSLFSAKIMPSFEPEISLYDPKLYDTVSPCKVCKEIVMKFECPNNIKERNCYNSNLHLLLGKEFLFDKSSFVFDGKSMPQINIGARIGVGGIKEEDMLQLDTLAKGPHTLKFRVVSDVDAQVLRRLSVFSWGNINPYSNTFKNEDVIISDCVK